MRKETKREALERRKPRRKPFAKILIVCEGKKTEPGYINGLKNKLRLSSANIKIVGKGVAPTSIVTSAAKLYQKENRAGDPFDKVFCVFDKDQHAKYDEALEIINNKKPKEVFTAITSVPAFEYWLLLHHKYSTRPCNSSGVLKDLKCHMPKYQKGDETIFDQLQEKLEKAKENARLSLNSARKNNTDNPSTRVHELVAFLEGIKQ